jgi:hypothetical protein
MQTIFTIEAQDGVTNGDFELILDDEGKYYINIETIYLFGSEESAHYYISNILTNFAKFMEQNEYDTNYKLSICEVFNMLNTSDKLVFESVPQAFEYFKMLALHYLSKGKEKEYFYQ